MFDFSKEEKMDLQKIIKAILVVASLTLCQMYFWYSYIDGPVSPTAILVKEGTTKEYVEAEKPCPGYMSPTIVQSTKGDLLGDCDGDGHVDEILSPQPAIGNWPYKGQWTFTPRTGVNEIWFKDGGRISHTEYPSKGYYSNHAQIQFLTQKLFAPKKQTAPTNN